MALLTLIVFGRGSATAGLVLGTWPRFPVLLVGWRLGLKPAALLILAAAVIVFIFSLHPVLETIWQNLGFLNLLLLGVMVASLQCRAWRRLRPSC